MMELDLPRIADHLARLLAAFVLTFPLGWERGRYSAGMRTFPVVAMASCGYGLLAGSLAGADAETRTRLVQGLLTGIGFIGGGAILKDRRHVAGLATAASIWNTGAIGVAIAFRRSEIAVALSLVNFAALVLLGPLARASDDRPVANGHSSPDDGRAA